MLHKPGCGPDSRHIQTRKTGRPMAENELKKRIEQMVEGMHDEIVGTLCNILRFRTVSGAPDEEGQELYLRETAACLEYLGKEAQRLGFEWRNHDNRCAVADLPGGEEFVGLPVHVDVVPPGDGWVHDPFGGELEQGTIFGRGCQDDKGPAVQMLYAMHILKKLGRPLARGARLIVGTAEECGDWSDIKHYFTVEDAPQISIVSDAAFPIINGEKGMLNLRFKSQMELDEAPDIGGLRFQSALAGERANIVPPRAVLSFAGNAESDVELIEKELHRFLESNSEAKAEVIRPSGEQGGLQIVFHGRGAHGSTPQEGHNAALDMLLYMTQSGFVSDDEADMAEFLHTSGSGLYGENLGIDERHPFIGPTTVNLGILQWNGSNIEAVFNIRNTMDLSVAETVRRAGERFNEFAEETGFSVEAGPDGRTMEPIYVDPNQHPVFIGALKDAYTTYTGREATLHAIGGTTYAKVFPNAVCFGPVDLEDETELAHQAEERIRVEHLLRNVKIYAYALARLCAA